MGDRPSPRRAVLVVGALIAGIVSRPGAQVTPRPTVEGLELAVDRLLAARHFPTPVSADATDEALLTTALGSTVDPLRAVAVRALGRFEAPANVGVLTPLLDDPSPAIRIEAGNALALSLRRASAAEAAPVRDGLLARLTDPIRAEPWMYDTLGRLPYARADADRIEAALVAGIRQSLDPSRAEEALVAFLGRDRTRPVAPSTRSLLEVRAGGASAEIPSLQAWRALQILTLAGPNAAPLLIFGATYHCPGAPDCGWKIREIATDLLDPADPAFTAALDEARRDESVAVRLAAVRRLARPSGASRHCAALVSTIANAAEVEVVRLEAMTLLDARCDDRDAVSARLTTLVGPLMKPQASADWHPPARALEALARVDPALARPLIASAAKHPVWQVRAAAVRAAGTLKDATLLLSFADDPSANVKAEAVRALGLLPSLQATALARTALASSDYQLVREGAEALKKAVPASTEAAPLLSALTRLTAEGKDTSRDPRTSILNRLKTLAGSHDEAARPLLGAEAGPALTPLLHDFDPDIATLAAGVLAALTGTAPAIAPTRRPVEQPSEEALRHLPSRAILTLGNGQSLELVFLKTDAPVMIARFVVMARAGYYTHLTFHRVEPLFVIQGGSPGANEYTGASRFFRDEIGLSHQVAGAVGMSTRGPDTGDGQLFVDLTDQYRLDYTYTVFAQLADLGPAERLLEGERIDRVVIKD